MSAKTFFVCTTINHPPNIPAFVKNLLEQGRAGQAEIIVIGDRKSPSTTSAYLSKNCSSEIPVHYFDLERQRIWLEKFPELDRVIPRDRIQRRNIGYLLAFERGADRLISIDDDNFPIDGQDYLAGHAVLGETARLRCYSARSGWYNVCSHLQTRPETRFYHRGYPLSHRWKPDEVMSTDISARVAVTAGFWLGDPDVDTFVRLAEPFDVTGPEELESFTLANGTWSPFNSQNTGFLAELLPSLFLIIEGHPLKNLSVWRYDDIWMSYFLRKLMDRKGDVVAYGSPWVRQQRNPHDFLLDLERELMPMRLTVKLAESLRRVSLTGSGSYAELYEELCEGLAADIESGRDYDSDEKEYFREMIRSMRVWLKTCRELMGR